MSRIPRGPWILPRATRTLKSCFDYARYNTVDYHGRFYKNIHSYRELKVLALPSRRALPATTPDLQQEPNMLEAHVGPSRTDVTT